MLNLAVGSAQDIDGRTCILTEPGKVGHAIYGPYEILEPGRYAVAFRLELVSPARRNQDVVCAVLDVTDGSDAPLALKKVLFSQLADGRRAYSVEFTIDQPSRMEYRVWVTGEAVLRVDEYCRVIPVPWATWNVDALVARGEFPEATANAPAFFREQLPLFRGFHEQGMTVSFLDGDVVLTVQGVSLYVRTMDDLNFIGEIFVHRAYNLKARLPLCVIDVGMNIGLTSLMLATKPEVAEVHAFEPFANTYDRAMDNLRLNPMLATKIAAHNVGLSDRDWEGSLLVPPGPDSGAMTTIGLDYGRPAHVSLKGAAGVLRPVIEQARARGRAVIVKLDCEGSEFPIMASLAADGLVPEIAAFMVEWHAMRPEHPQEELLAPLRANGFLVFDQSPPVGNGFFYAVRLPDA